MSDQQTRDRVRRMLDATARDGIPDNLDLRLDVLRVLAQRHGPGPDRLVHLNGEESKEEDEETLDRLRARLSQRPELLPQTDRRTERRQQSWPRETIKLAAAALVFVLVGGLLVITLRGTPEQTGSPQPTPSPIPVQPVAATIEMPGRPYGLAATINGVWVPDTNAGVVRRIDPATGEIDAMVDLGATGWQDPSACNCSAMFTVATPDGLWVTRSSGTTDAPVFEVVRLDPISGDIELVVPLEVLPDKLAFADDSIWVTSSFHNAIVRIDAATGAQQAVIPIDAPLGMIAATRNSVWVTSLANNVISRIDPATNSVVATITIGSPIAVAVAGEGVWVASLNEGALFRIDQSTNTVVARVAIAGPDWLTAASDNLWVHSTTTGEVLRLDPEGGEIRARFTAGPGVATMADGENVLWIALANTSQVLRIDLE